ncbi:alpha-amylase family glycosyl hydrolase [Aquabacterium sp. A7-Y]|uniref:alpha-amylase family glycosyl hydrolase n=1 Tax=Aquabacterium sp. A7-Y TaxID=1349605 RepID=UPI00223E817B|nr:alpha-amylase family glycosyl hydrolase [Aquabacterium sp. A7-Y]MCW7540933.1 alpha-amylase family glycosyl hydrolase [Aquabacterium sp. A7-Y]
MPQLLPRLIRRLALSLACGALLAGCAATPGAPATPAPLPSPAAAAGPVPGSFADNPIVYFVVTDRFFNGNPSNDHAYGRQKDGEQEIGTFHGGDLKGLTLKLREGYFRQLGVNALWITAPYEQIRGWVVGGDKAFKHYGYHGYYALDYSVLDRNMGTPEELREMVDEAHTQGIRVLFDVVMNHPGYLDLQTARELVPKVVWPGSEKATLRDYHSYIDYNSEAFSGWWGGDWVRAGLSGYQDGGRDDLTMQVAFLPDFRTESPAPVRLPAFLRHKPDTRAVDLPGTSVRGYLVHWLTQWVRDYGIDGFRADTVKHVEPQAWAELKQAATRALADWKRQHPTRKIDDAPFWMVGEDWGHGPRRSALHDAGFDALIDFDFQHRGASYGRPEALFAEYARVYAGRPGFSNLAYVSSHDTALLDRRRLLEAGTALLLAPGGVQIYYGDESARPPGPAPRSDLQQATRSDMNWANPDRAVLDHWRRLGSFRARHVALARGAHQMLQSEPYVFSRIDDVSGDRVVAALTVPGRADLPVGKSFAEGEVLHDAYSGQTVTVQGGRVKLQAGRVVLLERSPASLPRR